MLRRMCNLEVCKGLENKRMIMEWFSCTKLLILCGVAVVYFTVVHFQNISKSMLRIEELALFPGSGAVKPVENKELIICF